MKTKLSQKLLPVVAALLLASTLFGCKARQPFTLEERRIIQESDSLMTVMVIPQDSAILRAVSVDFTPEELASPLLETLLDKMLYTVRHPSQDGVGISAPQVGLNRRAVLVQRFDKPGEPFEAFVNVRIDSLLGQPVPGPEGCLSVPGLRGIVPRFPRIVVSYQPLDFPERVSETVEGFTAVIFQHECDHLEGILYIDKAIELTSRDE